MCEQSLRVGKTRFRPRFIILNTRFIILNARFIILNTRFIIFRLFRPGAFISFTPFVVKSRPNESSRSVRLVWIATAESWFLVQNASFWVHNPSNLKVRFLTFSIKSPVSALAWAYTHTEARCRLCRRPIRTACACTCNQRKTYQSPACMYKRQTYHMHIPRSRYVQRPSVQLTCTAFRCLMIKWTHRD